MCFRRGIQEGERERTGTFGIANRLLKLDYHVEQLDVPALLLQHELADIDAYFLPFQHKRERVVGPDNVVQYICCTRRLSSLIKHHVIV